MAEEMIDPETVLVAYRQGFFPMAEGRGGRVGWYSPDPRAIIPLEEFRTPRSLQRLIRRRVFEVRWNTAFSLVVKGCADREDTWISEEIESTYVVLHQRGYAHSVESWQANVLVGGLYGVALGGAFFGESMFSRVSNASKVALAVLVERLRQRGFVILDTQFINDHVAQFGAVEIPRAAYLRQLRRALEVPASLTMDVGEDAGPVRGAGSAAGVCGNAN